MERGWSEALREGSVTVLTTNQMTSFTAQRNPLSPPLLFITFTILPSPQPRTPVSFQRTHSLTGAQPFTYTANSSLPVTCGVVCQSHTALERDFVSSIKCLIIQNQPVSCNLLQTSEMIVTDRLKPQDKQKQQQQTRSKQDRHRTFFRNSTERVRCYKSVWVECVAHGHVVYVLHYSTRLQGR